MEKIGLANDKGNTQSNMQLKQILVNSPASFNIDLDQ